MVDIIVRAKGKDEMTAKCLKSIQGSDRRIILVYSDAGKEPPEVSGFHADIVINSACPLGAVTATNLGLAVSHTFEDSEYTMIMDNDAHVPKGDKGWLDRMIMELEQGGDKAGCIGATTSQGNPPQHILFVPQTYTGDWSNKEGRGGKKENEPQVWFVSFCVLFRKSVLKHLGPWDEQYNPGNFEDTDYAMQVRAAGFNILVARSVYIHHDGHETFGNNMPELMTKNQDKFAKKWGFGRLWDYGIVPDRDMAILAGRRAGIVEEKA